MLEEIYNLLKIRYINMALLKISLLFIEIFTITKVEFTNINMDQKWEITQL